MQNGRLVPTTSFVANYFKITGGANEIDLSRYSAFVVVGAGFAPSRFSGSTAVFVTTNSTPTRAGCFRGNVSRPPQPACCDCHRRCMWRPSCARQPTSQCGSFPAPWPSETAIADPDPKKAASYKLAVAHGDQEQLLATFNGACETISKDDIGVVHQPAETKASPILTQDIYSQGSVRFTEKLDEAHDKTDYLHMNCQYGEMLLSKLL